MQKGTIVHIKHPRPDYSAYVLGFKPQKGVGVGGGDAASVMVWEKRLVLPAFP